jgi:hypothetical protein
MPDEKPAEAEKPNPANAAEGQSPPPGNLDQLTALREALGLKTQALEGKTSLGDTVSIESAILAYHSLGLIGAEIAMSLKAQNVKQVVLLNPPDLTGFHDLRWIERRAEVIRKMFEAVKPPTQAKTVVGVAAIGTVAMVATTLIDLFSLFRVDVEVKSSDLTLEESALVSELARKLHPETKLFYPQVLPFDLASPGALGQSKLNQTLEKLYQAQQEAEGRAAPEDKDLEAAKVAFQSLREDLFKIDETGTSLLARLLRAELLASRLEGDAGHLLYLKIAKAGGSQKTAHSRLKAKDSISYSGGAVVTYILFANDGSVALSQTLYLHSGFREFARGDDDEFPLSNF